MESDKKLKMILQYTINDQKTFRKFINTCQTKYCNSQYPVKTKYDNIDCLICGGTYTRQMKSIHDGTKKHIRAFNKLYDYFKDF